MSASYKKALTPAYEDILWLTKTRNVFFVDIDQIRTLGNEAREGRAIPPKPHEIQAEPVNPDMAEFDRLAAICRAAKPETPYDELPSTTEISRARGFDPEKKCPICWRKWRRHVTRKRIGGHEHYPVFTKCNPKGKNPGNVWEISTKAHYGNEHFAIFPEELVEKILSAASKPGDWVLDPFVGRGTTGIVAVATGRKFIGIDLYQENIDNAKRNLDEVKVSGGK